MKTTHEKARQATRLKANARPMPTHSNRRTCSSGVLEVSSIWAIQLSGGRDRNAKGQIAMQSL